MRSTVVLVCTVSGIVRSGEKYKNSTYPLRKVIFVGNSIDFCNNIRTLWISECN